MAQSPSHEISELLQETTLANEFKAHRKEIRLELKDIYNRLHSIAHDGRFIEDSIRPIFPYPIVPNQRCGAWYVSSKHDTPYAYFKSTDTHATTEHKFIQRRANLSLLPIIIKSHGIVIVDSTRRGKRFPDALSKTIPVWCAVLNATRSIIRKRQGLPVDSEEWEEQARLWTLPTAVSRSEHALMAAKIDEWAGALASSAYDLTVLASLQRPLRPLFVTPASRLSLSEYDAFYPVICVSASKLLGVDDLGRDLGFAYCQGAGDDHEAWSQGLTANLYWEHHAELLAATRNEVEAAVERIVSAHCVSSSVVPATSVATFLQIRNTGISLTFNQVVSSDDATPATVTIFSADSGGSHLPLPTFNELRTIAVLTARTGKAGFIPFFFQQLPPLLEMLSELDSEAVRIHIAPRVDADCQSGANDLGIALALILLVKRFDDDGNRHLSETSSPISKQTIRTRLAWVLEQFPTINPSRAILIQVNAFLIPR